MRLYGRLRLCVVLLPLAGCGRSQGASSPPSPRPLSVRVAPVTAQDVVYRIRALGSLESEDVVQITAQVEGVLSELRFREGDRVTPRTVLARIDPTRYELESHRADAAYKKALADFHRAQADLERREELAREQLVAAEELSRARQEAERLDAEAESMRAARDIAVQNWQRSSVVAPRGGVIDTKNASLGQYVHEGTVLATLVDLSRLKLRFKVSEAESLRARGRQTVTFRVSALGDRDFVAKVYHVGEMADPTTRQVEILGSVVNPGVLKPGFFAEVMLASEVHHNAVVVPEGAVQASERGFIAYVVENLQAHVRPIEIGLRTGTGIVEILSGLRPGETVVVEGSDRLSDGIPLSIEGGAPQGGGHRRGGGGK